jgi:hypothetical protein
MTSKLRKIATTTHAQKYAPNAAPGLPDSALTSDPIPRGDSVDTSGTRDVVGTRSTAALVIVGVLQIVAVLVAAFAGKS